MNRRPARSTQNGKSADVGILCGKQINVILSERAAWPIRCSLPLASMIQASFNVRLESTEDLPHRTLDKIEDVLDGQVGSETGRAIAEKYLDGRVNLHVHSRHAFDTEEYRTIFDRGSSVSRLGDISYWFGSVPAHANLLSKSPSNEKQMSMLVRNVELVEIPKMKPVVILAPTIAWLKSVNDGNHMVGYAIQLAPLVAIVLRDTVKNWELVPGCGRIPIRQYELPHKMVQGNTVTASGRDGINLYMSMEKVVRDNTVSEPALAGIALNSSNDTTIQGNTVTASGRDGINLYIRWKTSFGTTRSGHRLGTVWL